MRDIMAVTPRRHGGLRRLCCIQLATEWIPPSYTPFLHLFGQQFSLELRSKREGTLELYRNVQHIRPQSSELFSLSERVAMLIYRGAH